MCLKNLTEKVKVFTFSLCALLMTSVAVAQTITVTGNVKDKLGPAIGVTVQQQGTNNAVVSDVDGNYIIKVPSSATLTFSFVGLKAQSIVVNGRTNIDVMMEEDAVQLGDVVVVGFGTQKRANLTGAVSTVDTKALEARPITDLNQGLQGVTPGLSIGYSSGQLNGSPTINVRGTGTMIDGVASGGPLVLVDGIPTSMDMLNPDDVESISVLKDAASASIYGARAAFGVVLVTTKRGTKTEKIKFSYTGSVGFSNPTKLIKHMDAIPELEAIIATAEKQGEVSESWGAYHTTTLKGVKRWYENYSDRDPMDMNMIYGQDWENVGGTTYFYRPWDVEKLMFGKNVPNTSHSLSMSGRMGENSSIMASLGYTDRKGVMRTNPDNLRRYNATVNINTKLAKWLTADIRVMASRQDYDEPYNYMGSGYSGNGGNGYFGHIYRYGSYAPYGKYKDVGFGFAPSFLEAANTNTKRTDYVRLATTLKAQITKDITVTAEYSIGQSYMNWRLNGGVMNMWRYQGAMVDPNGSPVPQGATPGSSGDAVKIVNSNESTSVFNAYARYGKTFGENHNFSAQVGVNTEWNEYQRSYSARLSLLDPSKPEIDLATGTQFSTDANGQLSPAHRKYAIAGLFARVNYDYKGKYLLEVNARYDGSSKFPRDSQWAIFPSGSIGWRVTEENFMQGATNVINNMKLRFSAGTIGNQNVKANAFEAVMEGVNAYWMGAGASTQSLTYGLPYTTSGALTWEQVTTYDVGLDLNLFNMFNITADWYQRNTNGMLAIGEALPQVFGASAPLTNAGDLRTRGYEIALGFNKAIGERISIYANIGFSDSKSVVTKWSSAGVIGEMYEGMEVGEIWGLKTDRLLQTSDFDNTGKMNSSLPNQSGLIRGKFNFEAGDVLYQDLDGDGKISGGKGTIDDHGDLVRIGNNLPRYEYNFRVGGEFYGFDLNIFFQGVGSRQMAGGGSDVFMPFQRGYFDLLYAHQSDYWTASNPGAYYPRLSRYVGSNAMTGVYGSNNSVTQSRYLLNLSYLRLKNVTVGYTIPKHITNKIKIDKVRVYVSGENLLTFQDKNLPVDPEVTQTEHMLGRSFPLQKTISVGLQVNF